MKQNIEILVALMGIVRKSVFVDFWSLGLRAMAADTCLETWWSRVMLLVRDLIVRYVKMSSMSETYIANIVGIPKRAFRIIPGPEFSVPLMQNCNIKT